jgi:putative phage-type endonuclease
MKIKPEDASAARQLGIGSSDIAAIVGRDEWRTPYQVWAAKVGAVEDDADSDAMKWGRILEAPILDAWAAETGAVVAHRGETWWDQRVPWLRASPDAVIPDEAVVEIKTTGAWAWDDVPERYILQVQWQMFVTELPRALIVALHLPARRLETYPVAADTELQAGLAASAGRFWRSHVETHTPPDTRAEDSAFLASLWPRSEERAAEVDLNIVEQLARAREAERVAKVWREECEANIKATLGEADTAVVGDTTVATWKTQGRRAIDTKRLRAERPEIAEEYTSESTSRVFRFRGMEA